MDTTILSRSRGYSLAVATALLSGGILVGTPAVSADVLVNMNFSAQYSHNPTAPAGTPGALVSGAMDWNNVNVNTGSVSVSNLINTNGTSTSIGVSVSGASGGYNSILASASSINPMLFSYPDNSKSSPVVATFSGLDATGKTSYNLYVYNWSDYSVSYPGYKYTVTSSISEGGGTLPGSQTNSYTGLESGTTFTQGVNYVLFNGLTANSSGVIQLSVIGAQNLNGVQLDAVSGAVPEPTTIALTLAGAAGFLLLAKRRPMKGS